MPKAVAAMLFLLVVLGAGPALAAECYPHCDYNHNYGPYNFTYIQPGLFGYPRCDARGECAPNLVYSYSGVRRGRVTVRLPRQAAPTPPQ